MLLASSYAGMGFGNAGVHLCHGLSYPISSQGKSWSSPDYPSSPLIPHGLSVILTACEDFRFTCDACPDRHLDAAACLGYDTSNAKQEDGGEILADIIKGYMSELRVANGLKAVGFGPEHVAALVDAAFHSISALQLAPKEQTREELERIYNNSMVVY